MLCPGGKSLFGQSIPASRPGGEGYERVDWELGYAIGSHFYIPNLRLWDIASLKYWCELYAEVCSILHSSWAFSFRLKLLILRYCKDPDAEKRKASPCRKIMPFTELFQDFRREVCRCGTLCWHGISCNVAGNLESATFPAHSSIAFFDIFCLISARCDSFFYGYSKQKPACVISRIYCWELALISIISQENRLRCFASCAEKTPRATELHSLEKSRQSRNPSNQYLNLYNLYMFACSLCRYSC